MKRWLKAVKTTLKRKQRQAEDIKDARLFDGDHACCAACEGPEGVNLGHSHCYRVLPRTLELERRGLLSRHLEMGRAWYWETLV